MRDLPGKHHTFRNRELDGAFRRVRNWGSSFFGAVVGPVDVPENVDKDEPFTVSHDLGQKPGTMTLEDPGLNAGELYATAQDRKRWNTRTITIRCTTADKKQFYLRLRGDPNARHLQRSP